MDNVTHAFFGYALARATPPSFRATPRMEAATVWTGILASNLPDMDFVVAYFTNDVQLGYLLHHRGHTHTILFALPIGLASAWLAAKGARLVAGRTDWMRLFAVGVTAALLHVGADALNNYGVHPFYPLDNRWRYGDALFIIEPLILFSLIPLVALHAQAKWARTFGFVVAAVLLVLVFWLLPLGAGMFVAFWLGVCVLAQWRLGRSRSPKSAAVAFAGLLIATVAFAHGSSKANARVRSQFGESYGTERLLDVVQTPMPGVPICWELITVSTTPARDLVLRRAVLALEPSWMSTDSCRFRTTTTTAPLQPLREGPTGALSFESELRLPVRELERLRGSCRPRAILKFLRVPFWVPRDASHLVLGDLRYDRSQKLEFAEFLVDTTDVDCPEWVPPWVPPRADVE